MPRGKFDSTNQKHYPDLGSDASSVWNSALVSQTSFGGETSGSVAKCRLFSEASKVPKVMISRVKIHLPFLVLCNWLGKYGRIYYALSFSFYLGARTAQGK